MKDYKIIMMNLQIFFSKILDCIYCRKCYLCSQKCFEISVCEECLQKINSKLKFKYFQKFNAKIYSGASYSEEILKIIRAFKYHKKREFEKILTQILIKIVENYKLKLEKYIVCPVPIHKNRFAQRKYNHMELVGEEFAKFFNLKLKTNWLHRIKDTAPLYKLSAEQRHICLKGAFKASKEMEGKKILLIDDIITTGTTIKELSEIILQQKPSDLIVLCATRSNNCNI